MNTYAIWNHINLILNYSELCNNIYLLATKCVKIKVNWFSKECFGTNFILVEFGIPYSTKNIKLCINSRLNK